MENFKSYFFNPLPLYVAIVFFSLQFFSALIISPSLNIFLSSCLTLWFFTTVQTLVIKSNQINLRTNLFQKLILKYNSYDIQRNEIIFYGKGGAKTIVLDEGFKKIGKISHQKKWKESVFKVYKKAIIFYRRTL